jgi:hypothetical protein
MYKMYKDGIEASVDKTQVVIFENAGWSFDAPQVEAQKEVAVEEVDSSKEQKEAVKKDVAEAPEVELKKAPAAKLKRAKK